MRNLVFVYPLVLLVFLSLGRANAEALNLEDRALISDQLAKYSQYWDRKDAEPFSELFAEDGVMEWRFADKPDESPSISGRAEILKYARKSHAERLADRQSRHHFSGLVFEHLTKREALTEHLFMVTHVIAGEPPFIRSTGVYRIEWRKTDHGWLIAHRTLFLDR